MQLLEVKDNIVTININLNAIRKFNTKKIKAKIDYGDVNEFLIEKIIKGDKDAIIKGIDICKKALIDNGCSTYEQLFKKVK